MLPELATFKFPFSVVMTGLVKKWGGGGGGGGVKGGGVIAKANTLAIPDDFCNLTPL